MADPGEAGPGREQIPAGCIEAEQPRFRNSPQTNDSVRSSCVQDREIRTLATIRPPTVGATIAAVTAARGERTFIVVETQGLSIVADPFYLFQQSSSGRPGALSRLPVSVPGREVMTGFALSP